MINRMKQQSKRILILFFGIMLVACKGKGEVVQDDSERIVGIKSNYLVSGKAADGTNYYTITRNDGGEKGGSTMIFETIPSIYAIDMQMLDTKRELGISEENNQIISQSHLDEFMLNLYDLDSNVLIKTIDAKKIMEQEDEKIQPAGLGFFETRSIDGMPYLGFRIENYPESLEAGMISTRRMCWINLETEETLESEEDWSGNFWNGHKDEILRDNSFAENNFPSDNYDVNGAFNVSKMRYWKNCYFISMRLELLPEKNTKLYAMFPQLKEQVEEIEKQEGNYRIRIYLTGNPSRTEIMELCLPEGQEIVFEEMILPAQDSIDGEEHTVRNLEEYEKYVRPIAEDTEGARPIFERRP